MASAIHCAHYDDSFSMQDNALVLDGHGKPGLIEFQIFCAEQSRLTLEALVKAPRPANDTYLIQIDDGNQQVWKLCENDCIMEDFEFKSITYGYTSKLVFGAGKHDVRLWSLQNDSLLQYLQIGAVNNEHSNCYFQQGNLPSKL